ncbi:MAG TPA: AAA domain-containing protein [Nitrospira sp.]|nr:AAA domain-containing protein [Nitrospira sp.]
MTVTGLIESYVARLEAERQRIGDVGLDAPVIACQGRLLRTIGALHLYELTVPREACFPVDVPLSLVPSDGSEPAEGIVLQQTDHRVVVQVNDALGVSLPSVTLVPDQAGLLGMSAARLKDLITKVDAYNLGPSERLAALLQAGEGDGLGRSPNSSALTTVWLDERSQRRHTLANLTTELIRANKRILLISPDHQESDEIVGVIARKLKAGGLSYTTWISRYEMPLLPQADGIDLSELGFEAQMHQFYARSRFEKDSLRRKYERFRELTPFLSQKEHTQKDLDEVRLLEWRHVTQLRDLQAKMAEVMATLTGYENLPLLQRLGLQAVGKNVESLKQYQVLYQKQIDEVSKEIDSAQARIRQLVPEAAVPRDIRLEFDELKAEVERLGGTRKIRELLAAEADPNRQAFLQNRRLVAATPSRVASDPLFGRVRFDVLIADEAPRIAAASLLAAAGLVRERIIISGDQRDVGTAGCWQSKDSTLFA